MDNFRYTELKHSKHKYSFSEDSGTSTLVVSLPSEYASGYFDAKCDLTISPSMSMPGKTLVKVFDRPNKIQRRFLLNSYKQILSDYNNEANNKITDCIIVYEHHTDPKGKAYGNVHSHALLKFETSRDIAGSTARIWNIARSIGFCRCAIEPLLNQKNSWDYIMKPQTKFGDELDILSKRRTPVECPEGEA